MKLWQESISGARSRLAKREISSVELLESVLQRIREVEPALHCYLHLAEDESRRQARMADERQKSGQGVTSVTGIPLAIKSNMCMKGVPTTCASKILENFRPPYNATAIAKLEEAGAVIVGTTNMDEFAMGSSTENSAFGPTRNPWNARCVPGGSSGGSAAAVAAGAAFGALGSDTGGSIRQPASFCGIVGLKPTYGLVSRYGLVAFASSLDQIGPMARTVSDCATLLEEIAGHDPRDSTSARIEASELPDYPAKDAGIKDLVVGIPKEFFGQGLDPQVKESVLSAVKNLEHSGAKLEEVKLPNLECALSAYYVIASAEASSNLARYDGTRYGLRVGAATAGAMFEATRSRGFGPEVKRRIMLGTYALSAGYYDAFYLKAQQIRTLIKRDFDAVFRKCKVLVAPTSPSPAFELGEKISDPLSMYLSDVFTIPVNLAGTPGLSIPVGFSSGEMPIGMQILAPAFGDFTLLSIGRLLERTIALPRRTPVFTS